MWKKNRNIKKKKYDIDYHKWFRKYWHLEQIEGNIADFERIQKTQDVDAFIKYVPYFYEMDEFIDKIKNNPEFFNIVVKKYLKNERLSKVGTIQMIHQTTPASYPAIKKRIEEFREQEHRRDQWRRLLDKEGIPHY